MASGFEVLPFHAGTVGKNDNAAFLEDFFLIDEDLLDEIGFEWLALQDLVTHPLQEIVAGRRCKQRCQQPASGEQRRVFSSFQPGAAGPSCLSKRH